MAIDIDLNKLDKLIKDHHKKCNQDDVYEYMINNSFNSYVFRFISNWFNKQYLI